MKAKICITLLALGILSIGAQSFAEVDDKISQLDRSELREVRRSGNREALGSRLKELRLNRPRLTEEQKETIQELRESGDRESIKDQLNDWGIEKPTNNRKELRSEQIFQDLSEDQKTVIQELRESGDKEIIRERLEEFGVELPEKKERPQLNEEQKETIQELRESGDRESVKEYFEEIGLKKPRKNMEKRKAIFESLTEDEQGVLQEARAIARAGDKESAREIIVELFAYDNSSREKPTSGVYGFFKRIFNS
jgi:Tfp pilus assembly protein FimV